MIGVGGSSLEIRLISISLCKIKAMDPSLMIEQKGLVSPCELLTNSSNNAIYPATTPPLIFQSISVLTTERKRASAHFSTQIR